MIIIIVIGMVAFYIIIRCIICFKVNDRMHDIALGEIERGDDLSWRWHWDVEDFIFLHPFAFNIDKYIERYRTDYILKRELTPRR